MPSATPQSTSHPDIPPFPAPSTFSVLPDIYLLLARLSLLHNQPASNGTLQSQPHSNGDTTISQSQSQTQTQPLQSQIPPSQSQTDLLASSSTSQIIAAAPPPLLSNAPLLELKDLPGQIYPLKQRLLRAREAVSALPDVERMVEEQEAEIRRLEGMVNGLRGRLELLGGIAREEKEGDDVVMRDEKLDDRRDEEDG